METENPPEIARPSARQSWLKRLGVGGRVLLVLGISILAGASVGLSTFHGFRDALLERDLSELEKNADLAALRLSLATEEVANDLLFLAEVPAIQGIFRARQAGGIDPLDGSREDMWLDRLETMFQNKLRGSPHYLQVSYIAEGQEPQTILRVGRDDDEATAIPGLSRLPVTKEDVDTVLKSERPVHFLEVSGSGSSPASQHPVLRAATVVSALDEPFGFLVVDLSLPLLFEEMHLVALHCYVLNENGEAVLSGNLSGAPASSSPPRIHEILSDFNTVGSMSKIQELSDGDQIAVSSRKVRVGVLSPNGLYSIVLVNPYNEDVAASPRARKMSVYLGLLVSVLTVVLGTVTVRSRALGKHMRRLAARARTFAKGGAVLPLGGAADGETGLLVRSFDEMVHQVSERTQALMSELDQRKKANAELRTRETQLQELVRVRAEELEAANGQLKQEVDQRRSIAQKLQEYSNQLQLALNAAQAGTWSWNIETNEVHWDAALERIFGLKPGSFPGRYEDWSNLIHPEDLVLTDRALQRALNKNSAYDVEYRIRASEDGWRYVTTKGVIERDQHDNPVTITGLCFDITDEKRAQLALCDSEYRLRVIVENAVDGIITIDALGVVESMNPAAERVFGYEGKEVVGQNVRVLIPEDCREHFDAYALKFMETEDKGILGTYREVIGQRKDGSTFPLDLSVSEVRLDHRLLFTGILRDVSERKEIDEQLRHSYELLETRVQERTAELKRSNQELEEFAYVASHDLKEPLRMVTSFVELLERRYSDKLDGDGKEFIDFAVDGCTRMKQLIDDLLAYSSVRSRKTPFKRVDCEVVLDQALANLQMAIDETNTVVTHDPLPHLMADEVQLVQLLQNLVGNAIKYRGDRTPEIHIEFQRQGGLWQFAIRDNGIGIESQYAERIFVIFQRLHSKGEYEGTGIGLSVCKRIIERHGGSIWVESTPDEGSTFYFTIRCEEEPSDHESECNRDLVGGGQSR